MKFYLSSFKLGSQEAVEKLKKLIPPNKNTAFIPNALDFSTDLVRRAESEAADIQDLKSIGLKVTRLDLKDYFGKEEQLKNELKKFGVIWVRGGNVFVLRQAFKLSGLDKIIVTMNKGKSNILYGGYSAGVCILAPNLRGLELVDNANIFPYGQINHTIWEGLNIINYAIVPHYRSNHPESTLVEKVVERYKKENRQFKALHDGEVILV
jgi:dipeptidase E